MTETAANKGEKFVENLAHDLKSPIFSQINALNILLKDKSFHYNDIQIELLNSVLTSNIYMRDMVLNLLSGFRMKNSNIKIKTNCIKNTINFAVKSIEHMLTERNQTLVITDKCESPYAEYDEIEIKRVIINLLANAAKYGKSGTNIYLESSSKNGNLIISVKNKGKITFKNVDDVFKLYKTSGKENSICGSGLGLHISKQIIDAHNGKIKAENLDKDTVKFSFEIPIINTSL